MGGTPTKRWFWCSLGVMTFCLVQVGAKQGDGRDLNINAFKGKSWLVMRCWMWRSQTRLRLTTTHLLLFPSLTTSAWVRGRQERLRQRPARLWCHPHGTVTSSKKVLQRITQKNTSWEVSAARQKASCPHLSGVTPPINKLHFFCNWQHKYKTVRLSWTSHRLRSPKEQQKVPAQARLFCLVITKNPPAPVICASFNAEMFLLTCLHRASLTDLEIAQKRVGQYRHHRGLTLGLCSAPFFTCGQSLEPVGSKCAEQKQGKWRCWSWENSFVLFWN